MTLKEIAAQAGVSVSTVSRVLNQKSSSCASKELQDKIWAIAREGGYRPNEAARSLRRSDAQNRTAEEKNRSVSIILARITALEEEPFFAELFRALEIELLKQNITIQNVVYARDTVRADLSDCSGVIILGRCSQKLLGHILSQNKNAVGIWRNPVNFNVDEVVCDGKKAAEAAMRYLFSLGHKKIAYIGSCSYESRYVGYCDTLFKNNIPLDYDLIRQTDQTKAEAETAFLDLLKKKLAGTIDFTAVLCANDITAVRVLELLQEHKKQLRKTPVSVISIDDIEEAQNTKPYLTTVRIPRREMAHLAVLLLLDRIGGGHEEIVRNELPCRIVKRDSCYECKET